MTLRLLAAAFISSLSACAAFAPIAPREPAVRGLPRDDPSAALSAVWVGHATVLLRMGHRNVMTDPNLGGPLLIMPRITPASLTAREVPPLDAVLISHMHFDHFDERTLRKLGPRPAVFFPQQGAGYASRIDQPRKRALATWEQVKVGDLTITAVPARHSGGRYGLDALWNHAYTGYVIEGAGRRVFFAGDTGYDPHKFREIGERFPGIDLAFIPIAPGRKEGQKDRWGHVGPRQALDIFAEVGARYMVPIHFESYYRVGGADRSAPRRELTEEVRRRRLDGRVFALRTGERIVVPEGEPFVVRDTSLDSVRVVAQP